MGDILDYKTIIHHLVRFSGETVDERDAVRDRPFLDVEIVAPENLDPGIVEVHFLNQSLISLHTSL